jgi:predicted DNA-binding transcriptional regulator AlpA
MQEIDDEQAVSRYTGKSVKTLQNMRWRSEGPPYCKLGGSVRYRKSDVDAWIAANVVYPDAS